MIMSKWIDFTEKECDIVNSLLRKIMKNDISPMPQKCPSCNIYSSTLHIYFNSRGNQSGGVWIWCDACYRFSHGSIHPPNWWRNLSKIELQYLTGIPEYLNNVKDKIDTHWNLLLSEIPTG